MVEYGPHNPHPLSLMRNEMVWEGKYDEFGRRREPDAAGLAMPLQKIETIDEPRSRAEGSGALFDERRAHRDDFRNRLVWGDNRLVMASCLDPHSNASVFARNPDNGDAARERTLAWRNAWEIPELTRRAESAALARAEAERAEIYLDLQRIVQRDSPFVAMFQETEQIALRRRVSGFAAGLTSDQTLYGSIRKS